MAAHTVEGVASVRNDNDVLINVRESVGDSNYDPDGITDTLQVSKSQDFSDSDSSSESDDEEDADVVPIMLPEVGAQLRAAGRRASASGIIRDGETAKVLAKAVVAGIVPLPAPPAAAVARSNVALRADCPTRLAKFDDVYNFRDIGGFHTLDGRTLKSGMLFRSSRPDAASEIDIHLLSKVHGVRTIVDLRALEETASLTNTHAGRVDLLYQSTIVEVNPRKRRHFIRRILGTGRRGSRSNAALDAGAAGPSGHQHSHTPHEHAPHEHRQHTTTTSSGGASRSHIFSPKGYSPLEVSASVDSLPSTSRPAGHVPIDHVSVSVSEPVVAPDAPLLRRVRVGFIGRNFMRNAMWSAMPWTMKIAVVFRKLFDIIFRTNYAKALVITRLINPRGIKGQYRDFVDFCKMEIVCVLRFIADASSLPVLVHCAHGKDRTGIVLAMTLACLGVSDEDIALDYGLSETGLGRIRDKVHAEIVSDHGLAEEFAHADPDTMRATLKYVRQKYGSVRQYLTGAGFNDDDQDRLRCLLLESQEAHEGFVVTEHSDAPLAESLQQEEQGQHH